VRPCEIALDEQIQHIQQLQQFQQHHKSMARAQVRDGDEAQAQAGSADPKTKTGAVGHSWIRWIRWIHPLEWDS